MKYTVIVEDREHNTVVIGPFNNRNDAFGYADRLRDSLTNKFDIRSVKIRGLRAPDRKLMRNG